MINPLDIPGSMKQVSIHYGKTNGVQLNHYILSFSPQETNDYKKVYIVAQQIASGIGRHFQTAFAVHEDRPYLHIHFIVNRISYIDGHRWRGTRQEFSSLCNDIRSVLQSHHIPTLQYIPMKASHKLR